LSRRPARDLDAAFHHFGIVREHLGGKSTDDDLVRDAVAMRLMSSIEAASRLDLALLQSAFENNWDDFRQIRNELAHVYDSVSPESLRGALERFEAGLVRLRAQLN
jgi:uncharacterized protein with HEPN domain